MSGRIYRTLVSINRLPINYRACPTCAIPILLFVLGEVLVRWVMSSLWVFDLENIDIWGASCKLNKSSSQWNFR